MHSTTTNPNYTAPSATQPVGVPATAGMTAPAGGVGYPETHGHTKRDTLLGAGAGAATGHTILGGVAGHAMGRHGEKHDQRVAAGAGAPAHTAGVGPHTGGGMAGTHPSTLDKVEGTIEAGVGKLTHNPAMVAQGQAKKTGGTVPASTVGTGPGHTGAGF